MPFWSYCRCGSCTVLNHPYISVTIKIIRSRIHSCMHTHIQLMIRVFSCTEYIVIGAKPTGFMLIFNDLFHVFVYTCIASERGSIWTEVTDWWKGGKSDEIAPVVSTCGAKNSCFILVRFSPVFAKNWMRCGSLRSCIASKSNIQYCKFRERIWYTQISSLERLTKQAAEGYLRIVFFATAARINVQC